MQEVTKIKLVDTEVESETLPGLEKVKMENAPLHVKGLNEYSSIYLRLYYSVSLKLC